MLRLRFVILAFAILAVLLVGCGEDSQNPLESQDSSLQVKTKEIIGSDGAPMVLIPAGEFQMGSNDSSASRPIHKVYLDAFYIDKYEVTNAQYRKFVQATGHKEPRGWDCINRNSDNQPVILGWSDAEAYAEWAGKRLPTEAEWEKAARGGLVGKRFTWGDEWPPPKGAGNFSDESSHKEDNGFTSFIPGYDDGYVDPAPVSSFNPNGYGLYDMAGNVSEWCSDWFDPDYYLRSPYRNPTGPIYGDEWFSIKWNVFRGGSWLSVYPTVAGRSAVCDSDYFAFDEGFRCAMDATK